MKRILAFIAVVLLLSGCSTPKDLPVKSSNNLPEQESSEVSSSFKEANTESSVLENEKGDTDEEVSVDLHSEKSIETESESPPESNIPEPTTPMKIDKPQEEASQPTTSQVENIPDEPAENREEAKIDEPKIEAAKSIYDYEFDVTAIQQELVSVGTGMGFEVDDSLTPSDSSWGNPITASKDFQEENLERALKDYVRSMPELITAYGGESIQYFKIYIEPIGDGCYCFYFQY